MDNKKMSEESRYTKSMTVILPVQINKVGTDIWRNTNELYTLLNSELQIPNMSENYGWKGVKSIDAETSENIIDLKQAFESETNFYGFYQDFTPEVSKNLYSNSSQLVHFIYSNGEKLIKEDTIGLVRDNEEIKVTAFGSSDNLLYSIRKIRMIVTIFGSCLLIIELHKKIISDGEDTIAEDDTWNIEQICSTLGIKSTPKMLVSFPTKCHPFEASLIWRADVIDNVVFYEKTRIYKIASYVDDDKMQNDILQFFGRSFECYWMCVMQKIVAMYISSWAGSSNSAGHNFSKLYEAYVLFNNQFNFFEVSLNSNIQDEYERIKDKMRIDDNIDKLIRQVDALFSMNSSKKEEKRNVILAFISVLSLVAGCMQVTESFGESPNLIANIASGIISLIIGLIFFFSFIK